MHKRIWLITGISSGLGKALAEEVMHNGDFVIGTFRKTEQVDNFNKTYQDKARGILLDVTHFDSISSSVNAIIEEFGRIDILVNNAGVGFIGAVEEASMQEIRDVMETNFFGTIAMLQAVLPHMRKVQKGNILQISSHAGIFSLQGFGIYNASKYALEGYSEALAKELAPLGIHVTLVEPGPFRTNFAGPSLAEADRMIDDYNETAGAFRSKLKSVHDQQEGHPGKAAKVIIEHLNDGSPTLRLPLGSIPLNTISMKIESLRSDVEANREKASRAVY